MKSVGKASTQPHNLTLQGTLKSDQPKRKQHAMNEAKSKLSTNTEVKSSGGTERINPTTAYRQPSATR